MQLPPKVRAENVRERVKVRAENVQERVKVRADNVRAKNFYAISSHHLH